MIYEFLFLGITDDNVYLSVKIITRERMLNLGDRNRFKIIQGCHFQDHRISRHLASVLRETQPFDFFFLPILQLNTWHARSRQQFNCLSICTPLAGFH